jgi:uncharacterized protein (TIGR00290 family)
METKRVLLSWSSGKDSAWTLHTLRKDEGIEVVGLLTTVNAEFDRVSMHAVRRELLERQAEAAGLDLWIGELPFPCSNEQYEAAMADLMKRARGAGIHAVAFGDLFLEDIREYRRDKMAGSGIEPLFPAWEPDTQNLAGRMQAAGIKARVTCVDPKVLDASFAGRDWDADFLSDLPAGVDPCGENGEFHTFVYDGPMFSQAVPIRTGETVTRDGFVYADVLPG